jgi:hypothetical protein
LTQLGTFERRGAGTDAERRAALWLAGHLRQVGRSAEIEPFWCRPNWALAHVWHVALAIAGSLVSVGSPRIGGGLLVAAILCVILDERLGISPGRRLTPEHASQNVIVLQDAGVQNSVPAVHLIITANYDAGRAGWIYGNRLRVPFARLNSALGGRAPGWLAWLIIAMAWLLAIAILRLEGSRGTAIGVAQLVPTAALVVAAALLLEHGSSDFAPGASDNGSGVAVALALDAALATSPPRHARIELVLQGAGDACGIGLRRHLRRRRRELRASNAVILGVAAAGGGSPRWWLSDGPLVPLRYFAGLRRLCESLAHQRAVSGLEHVRGRGATPAFRARSAQLPAITIGALDERRLSPRSHQAADIPGRIDQAALDGVLQFGLMLVDEVDAFLRTRPSDRRHRVALRRPLAVLARRERKPADQLRA